MATEEWQTTCKDLQQRTSLLFKTQEWSDCTLVVGPEAFPFKAHKLILTMASPVFEAMFINGAAAEQDTFVIPDVKAKPFEDLLNYIYTENINIDDTCKVACELYLAASKYMIPQLAMVCAEHLCSTVTMETACMVYETGAKDQNEILMFESMQMMKQHISELLHHKSFVKAKIETLAKVFSSEELKATEMDLYHALERRVKAHISRKRSASPVDAENGTETLTRCSVRKALKHIRFLTFTLEEFAKGPAKSGLFTKTEALAIMLNIAKADGVPMPPGFSTLTVARFQLQRAPTPIPVAPISTSGVLRLTFPVTPLRSASSAPCNILGRPWVLKVIPFYSSTVYCNQSTYLSVYLHCESTEDTSWACIAHVDFKMLAAKCEVEDTVKHIEKTVSNIVKLFGVDRFADVSFATSEERGFVRDGKLTFEANVILQHAPAGATSSTSSAR